TETLDKEVSFIPRFVSPKDPVGYLQLRPDPSLVITGPVPDGEDIRAGGDDLVVDRLLSISLSELWPLPNLIGTPEDLLLDGSTRNDGDSGWDDHTLIGREISGTDEGAARSSAFHESGTTTDLQVPVGVRLVL